ncbi:MAG: hypothetical protein KBC15_03590 [Candidatus Levybacteria bacterium]|nr:hypothetical protein [Candidatus Levybacteria bacterium]
MKWLNWLYLFLLLAFISFPPKIFAGSIDDAVLCKDAFMKSNVVPDSNKVACVGGQILDNNGNVIPASLLPRAILHLKMYAQGADGGEIEKGNLDIQLNTVPGNNNNETFYEYCSVSIKKESDIKKFEQFYPRVAGISFKAAGYEESQTYPLMPDNPCMTTGGSQIGNSPNLQPISTTGPIGCFRNDKVAVGCKATSASSDSPSSTHADQSSCEDACKTWFYNPTDKQCSSEINAESPPTGYVGPFTTEDECFNGAINGTVEPTKPPKDLPPCKTKISDKGCTSVYSAFGTLSTNPQGFLTALFSILLSLSGGIALLFIIRSGYQLMTSQGDPEKVKDARERITSAIVGLLFIVFSLVILEVIGVDILAIPGLSR